MERRVFYPHGPRDVVAGFLSVVLMVALIGGVIYLLVTVLTCGHGFTLLYWIPKLGGLKLLALLAAAVCTMLYRERITIDPIEDTIDVRRYWFSIPWSASSIAPIRFERWCGTPS